MKKKLTLAVLLALIAFLCIDSYIHYKEGIKAFKLQPAMSSTDWAAVCWTSDRNDPHLCGQADGIGADFRKLWEVKLRGGIYSGGVMVDGKLYLADEKSFLSCLNLSDGRLLWEKELEKPVFSPLLWQEGMLYFGDSYGFLRAFDTSTQQLKWSYQGSEEKIAGGANITPDGQGIVFGSYDFHLRGLSCEDGRELFKLKTGNYINGTPAIAGDKVLVGGCDSYLRMVNWQDGQEAAKLKLGSYIPCSIAWDRDGGLAFACCFDGSIKAVSQDASLVWQYKPKGEAAYQCSPAVNSRYVVAVEQNGVVNILDKKTGALQGTVSLVGDVALAPLVDEHRALIADEDGVIYIIDLESRAILKQFHYGTVISAPLLLSGGILLVCDENGTVSCFQMDD